MNSSSILAYQELIEILDMEFNNNKAGKRIFIAIAGAPASGKSTISVKISDDINKRGYASQVLQMDGFHFDDGILTQKGLLKKKGAPETFDVQGLKNCLYRLQTEGEVVVPIFDRNLEVSRSSASIIDKETKIIFIEGNYLLLNSEPWSQLNDYYDYSIMLHCDEKTLEQRLIERWKGFKLNEEQIKYKVYESDLPNGVQVIKNSSKATFTLQN
jgi:pantothenate kinase